MANADETRPLITRASPQDQPGNQRSNSTEDWKPKNLRWIQSATWANVFLAGFDGTIAASTYAVIGSEFNAVNQTAWISTSYLITATAFQPLYGSFSDILGRRPCFFAAASIFLFGCLMCGLANSMISLNIARAIAGIGGGGLQTMATVILSDLIPFHKRGLYQAANNVLYGFGGACGASVGGIMARYIGWRWAFLFQVPVCLFGIVVGYLFIPVPEADKLPTHDATEIAAVRNNKLKRLDIFGALTLVVGLATQLAALNLGGNIFPWSSPHVYGFIITSGIFLVLFAVIETRIAKEPIMPARMLKGRLAVANVVTNIFAGASSFSYIFIMPLFFQAVLLESSATAGLRMILPSSMFPIGGVLAGFIMSKWGYLGEMTRLGTAIMTFGCALAILFDENSQNWQYFVFLLPANFGQGLTFPSSLFTMIAAFDQKDQAIATSTVYLFRAIGSVWGIAITSAVVQNVLVTKLTEALVGVPNAIDIIDAVRHSVKAIGEVPDAYRGIVISCYAQALRWCFTATAIFGGMAFLASLFGGGAKLERRPGHA